MNEITLNGISLSICYICKALVHTSDIDYHIDWHSELDEPHKI